MCCSFLVVVNYILFFYPHTKAPVGVALDLGEAKYSRSGSGVYKFSEGAISKIDFNEQKRKPDFFLVWSFFFLDQNPKKKRPTKCVDLFLMAASSHIPPPGSPASVCLFFLSTILSFFSCSYKVFPPSFFLFFLLFFFSNELGVEDHQRFNPQKSPKGSFWEMVPLEKCLPGDADPRMWRSRSCTDKTWTQRR